MTSVLAIGWEPELRGILIVIIGVGVLCGSIYFVLATNLGVRLGLLVALAGLFGWMALMGLAWLIYGIGLVGPAPTWEPVLGQSVLTNPSALVSTGVLDSGADLGEGAAAPEETADAIASTFSGQGWTTLGESDAAFGQASSRAGELVEETGTAATGDYQVVRIFDRGGNRYPKIGDSVDFLAFFHKPRYSVAEVAPIEQALEEPGRAPATPEIDETQPRYYVYMVRDLGAERQPAAVLLIGSTIILLALCYLLHRRDALVRRNIAPTTASAT